MRRLHAVVAALAAALLVAGAPPASAGGPTSVHVVNYVGSRASAALTGSAHYANLEKALDPYERPTGDELAPAAFMDTQLRLTCMIHDVTPWRVDAVSIDGSDVWVETSMDPGTGKSLFETPAVRHRPADADLLIATLTSLGVLGEVHPGSSTAPSVTAAPRAVTPAGASTPGGVPWWATTTAAVLALGLGVGLGVGLGRRVRPCPTRDAGPRTTVRTDLATGPGAPDPERVPPVGFTADAARAGRRGR